MNYGIEKDALEHSLRRESELARQDLRLLKNPELDLLIDALDWLAAYADAEAIRRAENRP